MPNDESPADTGKGFPFLQDWHEMGAVVCKVFRELKAEQVTKGL